MAFTHYNGAVVASPFGKASLAYVIRNDVNQVAVLDEKSQTVGDWSIVRLHSFTGQEQHRASIKKAMRINVFGEGDIPTASGSAFMIVAADNSRRNTYYYSEQSPFLPNGILWRQGLIPLSGYVFDITLLLMGNVTIRSVQLEYTPITGV